MSLKLLSAGSTLLLITLAAWAGPASAASPPNCSSAQGQRYIDEGRYRQAAREFSCLIEAQPTEVEGYRGRIEAQLLLGEFSNAVRDYARLTAYVLPAHPDAKSIILTGYDARLAASPSDVSALTGASFAHWWFFEYAQAIHMLGTLLEVAPNDLYGNLFRGSNGLLSRAAPSQAVADLDYAITLALSSPDVRYIVSDAYTYGQPDPGRAFAEASLALNWGLDTPRLRAILASAYSAFGEEQAAAAQIQIHIAQVTNQLLPTPPLAGRTSLTLPLVPGLSYDIPVPAAAGETLSVTTSSHDFSDTILVCSLQTGHPPWAAMIRSITTPRWTGQSRQQAPTGCW